MREAILHYAIQLCEQGVMDEAKIVLENLAKEGLADAQQVLGYILLGAMGEEWSDYSKAIPWLKKAVSQGFILSHCTLGWAYQHGRGVQQNLAKAFALYLLAAEEGDPPSMKNVCIFYLEGKGVEQNLEKAFEWAAKLATVDYSSQANEDRQWGANVAARMCFSGLGTKKDECKGQYFLSLYGELAKQPHEEKDLFSFCAEVRKWTKSAQNYFAEKQFEKCIEAGQKALQVPAHPLEYSDLCEVYKMIGCSSMILAVRSKDNIPEHNVHCKNVITHLGRALELEPKADFQEPFMNRYLDLAFIALVSRDLADTVDPTYCGLCRKRRAIIRSHVIPHFCYKFTSGGVHRLQNEIFAKVTDPRRQTVRWMCQECDTKVIGQFESGAANVIKQLLPRKDPQSIYGCDHTDKRLSAQRSLEYDRSLYGFAASLLWRVIGFLPMDVDLFDDTYAQIFHSLRCFLLGHPTQPPPKIYLFYDSTDNWSSAKSSSINYYRWHLGGSDHRHKVCPVAATLVPKDSKGTIQLVFIHLALLYFVLPVDTKGTDFGDFEDCIISVEGSTLRIPENSKRRLPETLRRVIDDAAYKMELQTLNAVLSEKEEKMMQNLWLKEVPNPEAALLRYKEECEKVKRTEPAFMKSLPNYLIYHLDTDTLSSTNNCAVIPVADFSTHLRIWMVFYDKENPDLAVRMGLGEIPCIYVFLVSFEVSGVGRDVLSYIFRPKAGLANQNWAESFLRYPENLEMLRRVIERYLPSKTLKPISTSAQNTSAVCHYCHTRELKPWKCSRCKSVVYCSTTCQKADWSNHKTTCKKPVQ